ncbi:MAG: lipopolysaccharide heptosyltransferase II [Candidatus Omnitrophota bacterium]|nr:MAG: lipopolysaccharide heptosyltransferase II [Candidatus Omnitrophota bacterium]
MDKKILIINPFGIGDVLFTTPIINTLKNSFPRPQIGYLCNSRSSVIVENNPHIDYIFLYDRDEFEALRKKSFFLWLKKVYSFLKKIKEINFDLVLDFSLNTQYGFFAWLCGIKERAGYDYKRRGIFLNKKIKLSGYNAKHIVQYYADLLGILDFKLKQKKLELFLKEDDIKEVEEKLKQAGIAEHEFLVGLVPGGGASWGKVAHLKHWPAENFAQLADKIIEKYQAKIIILGDLNEQKIAKDIIARMKNPSVDFSGKTLLGQLAALISKTKLVIANDGGPLHMAVALGVKTVSFFGPVDPKVYGPFPADSSCHIVLRKELECSPCYSNFRLSLCPNDNRCLTEISVTQAMEAVSALITRN